jgi:hypothetical protein
VSPRRPFFNHEPSAWASRMPRNVALKSALLPRFSFDLLWQLSNFKGTHVGLQVGLTIMLSV